LRPGGYLTCYDWTKSEGAYSSDMLYWLKMEGLTYALLTLEGYVDQLRKSGFTGVEAEDASAWYRKQANHEYRLMAGDLHPRMVELLGQRDADHFVENWRAMVIVCDKGEMQQGYCRGHRPV
jgi:hypothetical protein